MNTKSLRRLLVVVVIALLLVACGGQAAEPAAPVATVVPPTETPVPPTDTPVPPTDTPVPATNTPEPTATPENVEWPSARGFVPMAYDVESDRFVVFGGQTGVWGDPAGVSSETWIFDANTNRWTEMKPASGPSPKAIASLVYDAESDRVILFGGGDADLNAPRNETWAYDTNTNTWTQMAAGPEGRVDPGLAYDAESDRVILFGGAVVSEAELPVDTWAYDFNTDTWTEMKPETHPPGRNAHGMAYDVESDRVLAWGGGPNGSYREPNDQSMWAYDYNSNTWEKMPIPEKSPINRPDVAMAYDAESDQTILVGGQPRGDETWAYDFNANTWVQMEPSIYLSRHAMAYSDAADRVFVFGGQVGMTQDNYTNETWSYDHNSNTWTKLGP